MSWLFGAKTPAVPLPTNVKQVIVIRKDLGMRRGKEIAQGAHGSCSFFSHREREFMSGVPYYPPTPAEQAWIKGRFTKICVVVDGEAELLKIHENAQAAGLKSYLILDAGLTEFKKPTHTCVCVGPAEDKDLKPITGHLKLY